MIYISLESSHSYGQRQNILQPSFCPFGEQKAKCEVFETYFSRNRQKHCLCQGINIALGLSLKIIHKQLFLFFLLLTGCTMLSELTNLRLKYTFPSEGGISVG